MAEQRQNMIRTDWVNRGPGSPRRRFGYFAAEGKVTRGARVEPPLGRIRVRDGEPRKAEDRFWPLRKKP